MQACFSFLFFHWNTGTSKEMYVEKMVPSLGEVALVFSHSTKLRLILFSMSETKESEWEEWESLQPFVVICLTLWECLMLILNYILQEYNRTWNILDYNKCQTMRMKRFYVELSVTSPVVLLPGLSQTSPSQVLSWIWVILLQKVQACVWFDYFE